MPKKYVVKEKLTIVVVGDKQKIADQSRAVCELAGMAAIGIWQLALGS